MSPHLTLLVVRVLEQESVNATSIALLVFRRVTQPESEQAHSFRTNR